MTSSRVGAFARFRLVAGMTIHGTVELGGLPPNSAFVTPAMSRSRVIFRCEAPSILFTFLPYTP